MKRIIGVMALAALLLSGCGNGVEQAKWQPSAVEDGTVTVILSESSIGGSKFDVIARKLPDGRWVNCIVYTAYYKGGIDCDWESASTTAPGN